MAQDELLPREYIDYTRKRLVWYEDFRLAGEYMTSDLAKTCDQLLIRTDTSHDTFVAFIPGNGLKPADLCEIRRAFREFGQTYHNVRYRTHIVVAVFVYTAPNSQLIETVRQLTRGPNSEVRQTFLAWTVSLQEQAVHTDSPAQKSVLRHLVQFSEPDTSDAAPEPRSAYRVPPAPKTSQESRWAGRPHKVPINPWMTHLLLAIIVGIFVLEFLRGGTTRIDVLVALGARSNILIARGQWWRLFTYQFLHVGILHLGLNGLSLYWLGPGAEYAFGHWCFLAIYLGSGTVGGIAGFLFAGPFSQTVSAGASGAVFGLFGAYGYFALTQPHWARRVALQQIGFIVVLNVVFGLSQPGIDNLAHLGGLVGGFLLSVIFGPAERTPLKHRLLAALALAGGFFLAGGMQLVRIIFGGVLGL